MSRAVVWSVFLIGLAGELGAAEVRILGVSPEVPIFGEGRITVSVEAEEAVAWVELRVDDRLVGRLAEPPYDFMVDLGESGGEHRFEALARLSSGTELSTRLSTPRLVIHGEIEADLQQLYVTVTDREGRRVVGLETADFEILDEGRLQTIVTLEGGEIPFTAVLLIDGSMSMRGRKLEAAQAGARAFVRGMKALDEAALMVFSDRLLASSPSSSEPAELEKALAEVVPNGGTAIYDFLFLALRALEQHQGRRVLVLLSDGDDIHSVLRMKQVRDSARRSQAQLFWVRLGLGSRAAADVLDHPPPPGAQVRKYFNSWHDSGEMIRGLGEIERIVEESGGRAFDVSRTEDVEIVFREILAELREQVAIGYYPTEDRDDGSWRKVEVEVNRPGLEIRAREGYLDF